MLHSHYGPDFRLKGLEIPKLSNLTKEPKKKKLDKCKGLQCTMLDKKEDENDIGKHLTASDFYKTGTSVLSKIFYWTTCSGLHDFLIFNCLPSPITPYCFLSLVSSVP